jgi:hypothetical protein
VPRHPVIAAYLIVLVSLTTGAAAAHAAPPDQQAPSAVTLDARVGFDGYIQQGTYAPIIVVAGNTGDDVQGELNVQVGGLTGGATTYTQSLELPRGSRKLVRLYPADFNTFGTDVTVSLSRGGRAIASQKVPISFIDQQVLLIGMWSDSPGALASLGKIRNSNGPSAVAKLGVDDFPPLAQAWDSLDVLVISNTDTGKLSPEQGVALREWVAHGGRLIITGGPGFQAT